MTDGEKRQARQFRKKDAYHLPELEISLEQMGAPNDPRIMSHEELEEYAQQFYRGEDINLYDFSKINFDSPFFMSLPATDRYNILNAARLRSRLRMGYSKEQLDNMFPDRMAFSKFQIERVKERNDLTQRLMNLNGMNGEDAFYNSGQRIAGERGKEYVLVKDPTNEGGWVLGVVGNKDEGGAEKPIDVDQYGQQQVLFDMGESDDEGGFEDVPIEGLNRLPKLSFLQKGAFDESIKARREVPGAVEDDSLFVQSDLDDRRGIDNIFEDGNEDEELPKAIAMSLEAATEVQHDHDLPEISVNRSAAAPAPLNETEPSFMPPESDDEEMDFAAALAQTKRPKREAPRPLPANPFGGPLPFESIKLKPSAEKHQVVGEDAGGFVKEPAQPAKAPAKEQLPLPPWFSDEHTNIEFVPDKVDDTSLEGYRDSIMTPNHQSLKDYRSPDVIDVDQKPEAKETDFKEVIDLETPAEKGTTETTGLSTADKEDVTNVALEETQILLPKEGVVAKEPYEGPTESEKPSPVVQGGIGQTEPSPSPEFEDVAIQPEKTPSVELEPQPTTEFNQQDALFVEEGDEEREQQETAIDLEDGDLMRQLAAEDEEHARFAATLNPTASGQSAAEYEQELKQLRSQQKRDRRDADEVTQVMISECQQLLALFGLPYITAPMEAEAQCAELVSLGLVDGIITDDSDIFLFGGTRVYKNMFNQSKFVECYLTSDMEKEYALHRKKLVSFAHLLGSDYTEGIPGIGPVTALEILTEFSGLEEFRDWWTQVQLGTDMSTTTHPTFYKKFKKHATKIFLPPSFPDTRVEEAYLKPEVDSDPSLFQWGVPDLHGLRNFLMATIGWSQERTDEVLVPVIRDMNKREQEGTQANITSFYRGPMGAGAFAPRVRSGGKSRMEKAFSRLRQEAATGQPDGDIIDADVDVDATSGDNPSPRSASPERTTGQKGKGKGTKRGTTPTPQVDDASKKRKTRKNAKK
ncbi:ssDNA endodeoxyribonuclease RAD2 [Aspergillus ruber CBS 135680]|uniref:XPG-I domain-containing protein n=1 Tax=Aspergillus ruber (strain CBS 135680) TaxID=1388766 RepID=A0A017SDG4_ASPRC|nr:uncharacterized protein EURHEDRAFT_412675 [Aspergillus ruber CBS 135680]EYE94846.1 hypothetical protein EURHEDRAFT_412675 [Aspergillus ruber CBS 135680]